jgi:hypothetical protein
MVRRVRLALLFCGEVYGQNIRRMNPLEAKNAREEALSNSWSLSHWTALMVQPNCMKTKAKKLDNVGKVSDFTRKGKVHIK